MPLTPPAAIRPLPLPESVGTTESAAFEEMVAVMNGVAFSLWGNDDFVYSADAELTSYRAAAFHEKLVFVAVVSGAIVGRVVVDFPLEQDALTATLLVDVVPSLRGRGIGGALLAKGEELAAEGGRTVVAAYTEHPVAGLDRARRAGAGGCREQQPPRVLPRRALRPVPRLPARPDRALEQPLASRSPRARRAAAPGCAGPLGRVPHRELVGARAGRAGRRLRAAQRADDRRRPAVGHRPRRRGVDGRTGARARGASSSAAGNRSSSRRPSTSPADGWSRTPRSPCRTTEPRQSNSTRSSPDRIADTVSERW